MAADGRTQNIRITFGAFELRQFRVEDVDDLYAVRNHESVRGLLTNPSPIAYESHVEWVNRNLIPGRDILLFLGRLQGNAIGFTLLKRLASDTVELGVMFREWHLHPTMGAQAAAAMVYLAFEHFRMDWAVTYVQPRHERAMALNSRMGGQQVESDRPGSVCFRQRRAVVLDNPHYQQLLSRIGPRLSVIID